MSASPRSSGASSFGISLPGVLIVGVGVDDEVGAGLEAGVDAGHERRRQPLVPAQPDDVIDAARARDVGRAVARPVVDDERSRSTSMPGTLAADRASVAGSVAASLRHGIWMISFFTDKPDALDHAVPGDCSRARRTRRRPAPPRAAGRAASALIAVGERLGLRRAARSRSRRRRRTRSARRNRSR